MTGPLVTIGLNTFNAEDTVGAALQSVLSQEWNPVEIVVVDDASTDGTLSIVEKVAAQNKNIKILVNTRNSGLAFGRNRIIEHAAGEFVIFFDDDDISLPARLRSQYGRLTEYERFLGSDAPVVCHAAREQVYPDGVRLIAPTMGVIQGQRAPAGLPVAYRILMGAPLEDGYGSCGGGTQMARTSTYRMLGGYDPTFRRCEDTEFCIRLARAGGHFPGVAAPMIIQKMTKTADKSLDRERQYMLATLDKHRDLFVSKSHYRFCCEWVELKHRWLQNDWVGFARYLMSVGLKHPLLTWKRARLALPNLSENHAFARFHGYRAG